MSLIKRILALCLCALLVCAAAGVYAKPLFNASVSLACPLKKSDVTYLSLNEEFDVALRLKTDANYFAGPFSAQVFYTNAVLKNASADFNTKGRFYSAAKTYSGAVDSAAMTTKAKNKFYPKDWSSAEKAKYNFCNITMVPNSADSISSPANLDETLATLHLSAGTATGSGTVFISASSIKTKSNVSGETYLSCLTDNGKVLSSRYDYGSDAVLDIADAALSFVVTDLGDVDTNKKINSTDALAILQHAVGIKEQKGDALRKCDLDGNGTPNSLDALAVLQLATGLVHINDIVKK